MLRQRINPHVNICTKANPVMISHMQTPPKLQPQIHNWSEMNVRETTVFFIDLLAAHICFPVSADAAAALKNCTRQLV